MELILWRHAEAEDGPPDLERRLTPKGEKQAEKMAGFLRSRLPKGARILVSPALRTQQTARALTKHFEPLPELGPGAAAQTVLKATGWPDGKGSVLVVGHQPYLGEIAASRLADLDQSFGIKKGAVWWLERRDHQTSLRLVIAPDLV